MTRRSALVVADDLTGANDTGHEFARRGYATVVATGIDAHLDDATAAVLVVNTDSRYAAPDDARDRVADVIATHPATLVYKKVDSTLRGNLIPEIEAALGVTNADLAVVAPAFPANGRTTACGYHFVTGTLVTDTPPGQDPDAPVPSSHVPTLFSNADHPVVHLSIDRVARGHASVREALEEAHATTSGSSESIVVCDATHESHLDAIADGAARTSLDIVYVGSAGLARHVRLPDGDTDTGVTPVRSTRSDVEPITDVAVDSDSDVRVVGVAGSTAPETREQVAAVSAEHVVALDPRTAVVDPDTAVAEATDDCEAVLAAAGVCLLTSARSDADVDTALDAGRAHGLDERDVRARVATSLSRVVCELWEHEPLTGLFVTGGSVATDVLDELDAVGVRLTGEQVESGIPIGRIVGGRADGTPVITKAGGFGGRTTIRASLAYLGVDNG